MLDHLGVTTAVRILLLVLFLDFCNADSFYSNVWAVHVGGGHEKAKEVAERNGFTFVEEVNLFPMILFAEYRMCFGLWN